MSLLRNFSPGGSEPDDDERPPTAAQRDETGQQDGGQAPGTARYAFAGPTAGTADPVPGTVVPSEVITEPGLSGPAEEGEPPPVAGAAAPEQAPVPSFTPAPETFAPGAPDTQAFTPETPTAPVQAAPTPVPPSRATGEDVTAAPGTDFTGADSARPDFTGPLLGDTAELRARWQRVQGDFVDDPRSAVSGAADLVGQTAEALTEALRLRQRRLRALWERGAADGSPAASGGQPSAAMTPGTPDTEQLRLMMQRYRALFNELCRPS